MKNKVSQQWSGPVLKKEKWGKKTNKKHAHVSQPSSSPVPSRRIKWINWSKMVRQRGTKSPVTVSKVIISDEGQGRGKTKQQNFQGRASSRAKKSKSQEPCEEQVESNESIRILTLAKVGFPPQPDGGEDDEVADSSC